MATPACKEEISKEWLQVILTQYESRSKPKTSVAVTSFEVNPGVGPGENFSSQLLKIVVETQVSHGDQEEHTAKTYNLLAKFMQGNGFIREMGKTTNAPLKEIMIYSDVIPALNQFQSERGDGSNQVDIPGFVHGVCVEEKVKYNEKTLEKLRTNRAAVKRRIKSLLLPQNQKIKCLCHGDYWNNNFMFRSDRADGLSDPDAIMLVDWGNTQWYTPVLDLQYLIHTSTQLDFRREHREEILQHYHSVFTAVTTKLGAPVPSWTFNVFKEECQKARIFGVVMGMTVNLITLSKQNQTGPLVQTKPVNSSSLGWRISCRLGKIMAPLFLSKMMQPLTRAFLSKWMEPNFNELTTGKNEILNQRFYDLLVEADADGVFDI
ncbi:hypothetical protein C7M84_002194 [Penaeus vannamei]|uniref:CHK kinase-like domain-containing protein n=1 Tax=Penaeus vannamei TaxID=6689 RepID=A0A3R7SWV4_PENVA|nr:hypothetical protein C7M84_002194 [Penaeus vannamei]